MKALGVISEYNPFHFGHSYHLHKAKEASGLDTIVCVMSGNYVQRGEPAIFDKWSRAEMALCQGIDLVLELPVLYATHSAYWFARGGIETLYKTGIVTHLTFGVETHKPELLFQAAELLASETSDFQASIKTALKKGLSFPKARAKVLDTLLSSSESVDSPNNILGISYLQVLNERNIPLIPVPIIRKGLGYNENALIRDKLPSATAIRRILNSTTTEDLAAIVDFVPSEILAIIKREIDQGRGPILPDSLNNQFMALLRKSKADDLRNIVDVTEGLENRILHKAQSAVSYKDFLDRLKTKRYTYTRLQRFLIHLLLDYTKEKEKYLNSGPPYLRVLGFSSKGRKLLKKIASEVNIPLITKAAHAEKFIQSDHHFRVFWEMDTLATDLYSLLYPNTSARTGRQDYYRKPFNLL